MGKASIQSVNGHVSKSNEKTFLLTDILDIDKLPKFNKTGTLDTSIDPDINEPVAIGSSALIKTVDEVKTFILFPDNEWTEI